MKYLYKYPQAAFPYDRLIEEGRRPRTEPEFELMDCGVFDQDRYFDVFVEYAKNDPEDICIRLSVINRGPETAMLDLLPTLWFRTTRSDSACRLGFAAAGFQYQVLRCEQNYLGVRKFFCEG